MLSDADYELVAAAFDGELSPAEEQKLQALLADSTEASAWFAILQTLQQELRQLPYRTLPASATERIIQGLPAAPWEVSVQSRPADREPAGTTDQRRSRRLLATYGIAASWLLAILAASFFWKWHQSGSDAPLELTQNTSLATGLVRKPVTGTVTVPPVRGSDEPARPDTLQIRPNETTPEGGSQPASQPGPSGPVLAQADPVVPDRLTLEVGPTPRESLSTARPLGAMPEDRQTELREVVAVLPTVVEPKQLNAELYEKQLLPLFMKHRGLRIECFVKDTPRTFQKLQKQLETFGVRLTAEAQLQETIQQNVPIASAMLLPFADELRLRAWLLDLGLTQERDPWPAGMTLHVQSFQSFDQKETRELLNVDVTLFAPKPTSQQLPAAAGNSPQSQTMDRLTLQLNANKNKLSPSLAVFYSPAPLRSIQANLPAVKQYAASWSPWPDSVCPVLFILRSPS